ncbi:putative transcriptional regulator PhnF [Variibacter gotjawalensis]|uniref:Putative transcriptional regulator PhnF n=1 Tax=Variibacter gotjawalensis TaxID=1333996 RepID=A0A0S3PT61_9BRAD|nr:phosphonate metabolism transcriptional regulator PhnF [Variibacter gotjawalensis]NIK49427.1 GntR family phosphonate transport system transcriptional regulator [Variibacter gotjawalensis]RZS51279.1 GntR family transcriptional regulator [Variibacter gotjawalensis]BAT59112.1 putative transcriptional regulator PhnF [Variibacter gotjawalensis]
MNSQTGNKTSLTHRDGISAWRKIADGIEADIDNGRLVAGEQLPPETKLAERFGVNRHTVRRAIAVLSSRGVLRATQGRGTFVEARTLAYPIGARARFTESVASAGREPSSELVDVREITADAKTAKQLAVKTGSPLLELRTLRRADGAPIAAGTVMLPLPRFTGFDKHFRKTGSLTRALRACGVSDYRRKETRIAARTAGNEEARLLEMVPGRTVLTTDGINVDADNVPVLVVRSAFAADRIELTVIDEV